MVVVFCLAESNNAFELRKERSFLRALARFDPLGTVILIPTIISLLLALQWGGTLYAWSDYRVIVPLVCFIVFILVWAAVQAWEGDEATVPWSVIKRRSVAGAVGYTFTASAAFAALVYYLPIWSVASRPNARTMKD